MADRDSNITNFFETTLSASMGPTDLTATVVTTSGGPASPCYIIIEPESASQREVMYMDGTFTATSFVTSDIANRYLTGSGAGSGLTHPSGSVVWVAVLAQHIIDLHDRIDNTQPLDADLTALAAAGNSGVLSATTASFTTADETKLDGVETNADVTDATNVDAAGAVMESDTTTASMSFVIDEDSMASDSATKVPTQQSVKAYVDAAAAAHIEAKETAGSSTSEAVTWTTAFSSTPVVTSQVFNDLTDQTAAITARSTTGATLENNAPAKVKMAIAMEAT